MSPKHSSKPSSNRALYSILAAMTLLLVFILMVNYIFQDAEKDGFNNLCLQTQQIGDDITLQMLSDQENLLTLARMAANHHADGSGFETMIHSFKAIGLIDNIAFLMPDDTMITRRGSFDAGEALSFDEEVRKGAYISDRIQDITNPELYILRSAVPVIADGKTVAILYGSIRLDTLEERYSAKLKTHDTYIYLLDSNGNFIIDTLHEPLGSVGDLRERTAKKGYSYQQMLSDIEDGLSGYAAFEADEIGEPLYMYHIPMEINDWQVLLSQPESTVFAGANKTGYLMAWMLMLVVLVMVLYTVLLTLAERRRSDMIETASRIRKLLIEINQHHDSILSALESITQFAKSRSAFFVDNESEDHCHIVPLSKNELLIGADRQYFVDTLTAYANKYRKDRSVNVTLVRLDTNSDLQLEAPEFYEFLKNHSIRCVCFAGITTKADETNILGVINPGRNDQIRALLSEIAVCFAMAVYNKSYLSKTETTAVTDSLTGLSNRLAYKRALDSFDARMAQNFSCVYVDVNELHIINNKFGHAAGDEMLLFVAYALREAFPTSYIYRMGGDEFLVFSEGISREDVVARIESMEKKVEAMNYHVSIGMDFRIKNIDTTAVVKEAEKRMYEAKAEYYQQKESSSALADDGNEAPAGHNYIGVYCVSFNDDTAYSILESGYFKKFIDHKDSYSKALADYLHNAVKPEYHRGMLSALKYEVLKRQLQDGRTPSIAYNKINGERIVLTVYALPGQADINETIWLFERDMEQHSL